MAISTRATGMFGIEHPVLLAPMDAVAGGELAAAVSRAGGLGMIGGGYGDETWLREQFALADGCRVGCGFITWALARRPQLLDIALEHEPVAVMLSFADPAPFAEKIKSAGALLMCQVQNGEQAYRALDVGADVLVAQGNEAGGHGYGHRTTMTVVPEIVDLVAGRGGDVAVLAAGGIADGRGLAAALVLGASGGLVGTRFYACAEALSTPEARQRVVAATGADICRTTVFDTVRRPWPDGHTISVLRNRFTARWHGSEDELERNIESATAEFRQAVAERNYEIANVTIGQAAGLIHSVLPAGEIVHRMVDEAATVLASSKA
jgi:nitronate monooxygenase